MSILPHRPYLIGCQATFAAVLIDPELSRIDHYRGLCAQHGPSVKYVIDTHTHADHFSACRDLGYTGAVALDGGMSAWREAGFPLEV